MDKYPVLISYYPVIIGYFASAIITSLVISHVRKKKFLEIFINRYTLISYSVFLILSAVLIIIFNKK